MILILTDEDYIKTDEGKEYLGYEHSKAYYNSELVMKLLVDGSFKVIAFRPETDARAYILKGYFNNVIWGEF